MSFGDRCRLALLIAASEQDRNSVAVFSKIDAITWSEVDLVLVNTFPNPFHVREIPLCETIQSNRDLCGCGGIQSAKPPTERGQSGSICVFPNLNDVARHKTKW